MRAFQKWISRIRWGALNERKRRGLVRLHDVLASTPLHGRYWVTRGLLLGCIREGGPLPHDTDVDFAFWDHDLGHFLEAFQSLRRYGFRPRPPRYDNDGRQTKWAFRYQDVKYEFFLTESVGESIRWITHTRKPKLELVNEVPRHGLTEIELYGRVWLKPDDHETYLESLYGEWRNPDPSFTWKDSRAVVACSPWKAA